MSSGRWQWDNAQGFRTGRICPAALFVCRRGQWKRRLLRVQAAHPPPALTHPREMVDNTCNMKGRLAGPPLFGYTEGGAPHELRGSAGPDLRRAAPSAGTAVIAPGGVCPRPGQGVHHLRFRRAGGGGHLPEDGEHPAQNLPPEAPGPAGGFSRTEGRLPGEHQRLQAGADRLPQAQLPRLRQLDGSDRLALRRRAHHPDLPGRVLPAVHGSAEHHRPAGPGREGYFLR